MAELSNIRVGRITSSEIVSLTGIGTREMTESEKAKQKKENPKSTKRTIECKSVPTKPFYTYIKECIYERFSKRRLENSVEVLALSWGKLCENIVHDLLGLEYEFHSDITFVHPKYSEWVGSPDGTKNKEVLKKKVVDTITETKCPLTLTSFLNLVYPMYDYDGYVAKKKKDIDGMDIMNKIRFGYTDSKGRVWDKHTDGEKYYWQIVSNACIKNAKYGELIVFMPYYEQLELIQEYNNSLDESYWFVARAKEGELPFIYKESGIDNLNIIRFEIPLSDKKFLEERVKKAIELINE